MLKRLTVIVCLLFAALGTTIVGQERYRVTANSLNVRSGPSEYYSVAYKLHKGDVVEVLENNGNWATIRGSGRLYYVNNRYLTYVGPASKKTTKPTLPASKWDQWYEITTTLLWIIAAVVVIGFFVSDTLAGIALWMLIICGIGALIGWFFFDNSHAGAVIGMGIDLLLFVMLLIPALSNAHSLGFPRIKGFAYFIWTILSLPFFILNMLQFWLAKPWRPLMKRNILPDNSKAGMRTFLRVMQIPFYIISTPLRFVNAVYYNILIYNLYAWSNYIIEIFIPSDDEEGAKGIITWFLYLPKRIGKYLLWHGLLTTAESLVWTLIDTFVPAVTLYHGTALECADNMLCDPTRNSERKNTKGWLTGIWNVGGGNYAGDGIYFGIFRKTLRNYEQGSAIATRVTMGKTIDTVLMPDYVYNAAGHPDAKAVSNWGLNHGYVSGEWWRSDRNTNWWEICLYDRKNRYNESWRIRPIYAIHAGSGIMQRIPGGPAHWLFRKQVVNDLWTTLIAL